MKEDRKMTTESVAIRDTRGDPSEFGRVADVTRLFGLKRGTIYNLIRQRRIKSHVLRVCGDVSGIRLIHLDSVRDLLNSQLLNDEKAE
jgi:hypothetical protein